MHIGLGSLLDALGSSGIKDCYPKEVLKKCGKADQGALRGKKLEHLFADEHLGNLGNWINTEVGKFEKKIADTAALLLLRDKLPPAMFVIKRGKIELQDTGAALKQIDDRQVRRQKKMELYGVDQVIFTTFVQEVKVLAEAVKVLNAEVVNDKNTVGLKERAQQLKTGQERFHAEVVAFTKARDEALKGFVMDLKEKKARGILDPDHLTRSKIFLKLSKKFEELYDIHQFLSRSIKGITKAIG